MLLLKEDFSLFHGKSARKLFANTLFAGDEKKKLDAALHFTFNEKRYNNGFATQI